jgi:hypothetical protein
MPISAAESGEMMIGRLRKILVALAVLVSIAQPAVASSLGTVTSITGSAVVMRGNSVEPLRVGTKVEKGDRIIVKSGGKVTLSGGTVIGPGASTLMKSKGGSLEVVTTAASSSSSSYGSNSSKLFSGKSGSYGGKNKDGDRDRDRGDGDRDDDDREDDDREDDDRDDDRDNDEDDDDNRDEDDDDDDDEDDDDDDEGYGDPDDDDAVSD